MTELLTGIIYLFAMGFIATGLVLGISRGFVLFFQKLWEND